MAENGVPRIRAHHLLHVKLVSLGLSMEALGEILVRGGYVKGPDHPFVEDSYRFLYGLAANPEQEVEVVAGRHDHICEACPKEPECNNFTSRHEKRLAELRKKIGDAFIAENVLNPDFDDLCKYGLEDGGHYKVGKLMEAFRGAVLSDMLEDKMPYEEGSARRPEA